MIFKSSTSNSAAHEWAFQLPMWADQLPWLFSQLRLCVPMQAHKAAVREDMNGGAADMYWWCPTLYMCKPRSICQLANMLGHTRVLESTLVYRVNSALSTVAICKCSANAWNGCCPCEKCSHRTCSVYCLGSWTVIYCTCNRYNIIWMHALCAHTPAPHCRVCFLCAGCAADGWRQGLVRRHLTCPVALWICNIRNANVIQFRSLCVLGQGITLHYPSRHLGNTEHSYNPHDHQVASGPTCIQSVKGGMLTAKIN